MNKKKHDKVNLEKQRGVFLQLGLVISTLIMLIIFEWSTPIENETITYRIDNVEMETDLIPIHRKAELKPPMPQHFSKIQLIPDDEEDNVEFELHNPEIEPHEHVVIPILEQLPEEEEVPLVFMSQIMPEFPGGISGLKTYIARNIDYPKQAIEEDFQGKVFVRFIINDKGVVENESIIRSVHPLLDKEALRVVRSFPKWRPGMQNGKTVKVWYTVPIVFKIRK